MRSNTKRLLLVGALASTLGAGCKEKNEEKADESTKPGEVGTPERNEPKSGTAEPTARHLSEDSQEFVMSAGRHGLFQIEMGQLAQQRAKIAAVREFAAKLVDGHRKANEELQQLVKNDNVSFPTGLADGGQDTRKDLKEEELADFDEEYMDAVIDRYQKVIDEYEDQSKRDDAPELQRWAAARLPTLRGDLEEAKRIKEQNVEPRQTLFD